MSEDSRHVRRSAIRDALALILGAVVVGALFGGIYALPAMALTRGKDPYLTVLLAFLLILPSAAIGAAFGCGAVHICAHWLVFVALLLLRRAAGSLDGNVERFGVVHALSAASAICLGAIHHAHR